jgi:hypothetical protein
MTIQQTLQSNTSRTRELFAKLEDTSDQAVKTRENLFEELSRELRLHAELEQKHLIPALRSHDKTKNLATDAAKVNQELRAKVDEIDALAKSDASFRPRLAELRKLFNRQLRDERTELLPAIEKELTDEQAEALVKKMEAKRAQVEDEQHAGEEERRQEARREGEHARAVAARQKAVAEVVDATKQNARDLGKSAAEAADAAKDKTRELAKTAADNARDTARDIGKSAADAAEATKAKTRELAKSAADTVCDGVDKVRETSERTAERVVGAARRAKDGVEETVTVYRATARERGADVKAVGNAIRNFAKVGGEVRGVMVNSVKQSGRDVLDMAKQVARHPSQFGVAQRQYIAASTRNLLESTKEIMDILRAASGAARQPVDQRLKATA